MEDDLKKKGEKKGRRPQQNEIEDDLNFFLNRMMTQKK